MEIFDSIFFRKNKLMIVTGIIHFVIFIIAIIVLFVATVNPYCYQIIGLAIFTLLMSLRAIYITFEKVVVNRQMNTVSLRILKKSFDISYIKAIRRIRNGQVRIIYSDNKEFPISIEDEDRFISLILEINPTINVN